jgi:hypothetical protein
VAPGADRVDERPLVPAAERRFLLFALPLL